MPFSMTSARGGSSRLIASLHNERWRDRNDEASEKAAAEEASFPEWLMRCQEKTRASGAPSSEAIRLANT